jgi:PLP dependent protein
MSVNKATYLELMQFLQPKGVQLIAVSKTKPVEDILELYNLGQRDFGENYVQELVDKQAQLPADIRWHFIGHLQSNKVKYIAPFVHLIHGVDSMRLLREINKQAQKSNRRIQVLLQMHISKEETKFGLDATEIEDILSSQELPLLQNIHVAGIMGMASFTEEVQLIKKEFAIAQATYDKYANQETAFFKMEYLSLGMSADFPLAIDAGSNMIRVGSKIFGNRG